MKKNKLNSVLLSVLLMVPGLVLCSEPLLPVQPSIFDRLWLSVPSMPAAPEWMTNFTSGLSDTKKYLLYPVLVAILGYIGYKVSGISSSVISSSVPTSMENRNFWKPNYEELSSTGNCSNIAYIIRWYDTVKGDQRRELAFKHYVCPVLEKFQDELDSKDKWQTFLFDIPAKTFNMTLMKSNIKSYGLNIFQLIKRTCPNEKITNPLKELLIINTQDKEVLQILNQ